jgi:hypothetical protein
MPKGHYHAPHIFPDGNQWCAVWVGFDCLANSPAGFGDSPENAHRALENEMRQHLPFKQFHVGAFCKACACFVPDGFDLPGCNRDDCPCQPPNDARAALATARQ